WTGVSCGSNSLRRAEKKSAPSACRFELANSVISMNISSGSFGGAVLFTAFMYSRSGLRSFAKGLLLLRRTTIATTMSNRTHNSAPIRKKARALIIPPLHRKPRVQRAADERPLSGLRGPWIHPGLNFDPDAITQARMRLGYADGLVDIGPLDKIQCDHGPVVDLVARIVSESITLIRPRS